MGKNKKEKKGLKDLADMPGTAYNDAEVAETRKAKIEPLLPAVQALIDKYKAPLVENRDAKQAEFDTAITAYKAAQLAFAAKLEEQRREISSQKAAVHKSFDSKAFRAAAQHLPASQRNAFIEEAAREKAELLAQVERDTKEAWFPVLNDLCITKNKLYKKKEDIHADLSDARTLVNKYEDA